MKSGENTLLLFDFQSFNSVCSKVSEYIFKSRLCKLSRRELCCLVKIIFDMTTVTTEEQNNNTGRMRG